MPEMDEPVNVDLEPDDALRILLGEERRESEDDDTSDESASANAD
ncbi:MAG TPA: hypothetical protein VK488_13090 [Gaiellaceae bacterium]|nr:hypothetical protein [Gaiellaceae bacterium]